MADANKRILQSALLIVALGLVSTGARAQPGGATPSAGQQSAAPAHPPTSRQCEDCHAPRSVR